MEYTEEILKIAKFMGIEPIKGFNKYTNNHYYYYNNDEMEDYGGNLKFEYLYINKTI